VCAFHVHYGSDNLHANIAQWRTNKLAISKSNRHGDRGVVTDMWRILGEHIVPRNNQRKLTI
jgi:hypothetical protein